MNESRHIIDFTFDWKFTRGDFPAARRPDFPDGQWRSIDLPHDWSIEGPFSPDNPSPSRGGYLPGGIGWYRKNFAVPEGLPESLEGRKIYVEFDGIHMNSDVWINGHHLGRYPYGYSSFHYDLSDFVLVGEDNCIAVRVDNERQPASRWYTGAGIYRDVRLVFCDRLHVDHWGTFITTPEVSLRRRTFHVDRNRLHR